MHAQALLDDGIEVRELVTVTRLFVLGWMRQLGCVQLCSKPVDNGRVADQVVDDGLLDGRCGICAGRYLGQVVHD